MNRSESPSASPASASSAAPSAPSSAFALVQRRRLRSYAYRFRESLFLLPLVMVGGFVVVAQALLWVDRHYPSVLSELPISFQMSPQAAQTFLSVLAGATITVAATVFSLTVVSLQLASGQFSPRVLRTFIRDRLSQFVVGFLVGVFSFTVLVLRDVRTDAEPPYSPPLSTGVTVFLAVAAVVAIIAYLDHLARSLQVGEVLRRIADETKQVVAADADAQRGLRPVAAADVEALRARPGAYVVAARADGWVRQASSASLLAALPAGGSLVLETRVGAFVTEGQPVGLLWLAEGAAGNGPVAGRTAVAVVEAEIDVGRTRTMQEDVDFGLRQMTDVALRALSPAINDPTTAVEVVLRLGSVLSRMLAAEPAPNAVADDQGRTVVRDWELDPAEYVGHAFDQIRLACVRHPAVCMAVLRTLRMLRGFAEEHGRSEVVPALRQQAGLLLSQVDQTARTTADMTESDRARIHDADDAATDNPHHGCYAAPRRTAAAIEAK